MAVVVTAFDLGATFADEGNADRHIDNSAPDDLGGGASQDSSGMRASNEQVVISE